MLKSVKKTYNSKKINFFIESRVQNRSLWCIFVANYG